MHTVVTEISRDDVEKILLYHSRRGFDNDLKDIRDRIGDIKEKRSEIAAFSFNLAVPANKNNVSAVEICVIKNITLSDLEFQEREFTRFIDKLNNILEALPPNEKRVIYSRYFGRCNTVKEFKRVAPEVHFSEDWCEELNKRALESIKRQLSGIRISWNEK